MPVGEGVELQREPRPVSEAAERGLGKRLALHRVGHFVRGGRAEQGEPQPVRGELAGRLHANGNLGCPFHREILREISAAHARPKPPFHGPLPSLIANPPRLVDGEPGGRPARRVNDRRVELVAHAPKRRERREQRAERHGPPLGRELQVIVRGDLDGVIGLVERLHLVGEIEPLKAVAGVIHLPDVISQFTLGASALGHDQNRMSGSLAPEPDLVPEIIARDRGLAVAAEAVQVVSQRPFRAHRADPPRAHVRPREIEVGHPPRPDDLSARVLLEPLGMGGEQRAAEDHAVRHHVEKDLQAPFVRLPHEPRELLRRPQIRVQRLGIGHAVEIEERRVLPLPAAEGDRIEENAVDAEIRQVAEPLRGGGDERLAALRLRKRVDAELVEAVQLVDPVRPRRRAVGKDGRNPRAHAPHRVLVNGAGRRACSRLRPAAAFPGAGRDEPGQSQRQQRRARVAEKPTPSGPAFTGPVFRRPPHGSHRLPLGLSGFRAVISACCRRALPPERFSVPPGCRT